MRCQLGALQVKKGQEAKAVAPARLGCRTMTWSSIAAAAAAAAVAAASEG